MALVCQTQRPMVSDDNLAVIIYLLYAAGYFFVFPALAGVVIAYVKIEDADPVLRSHYQFQIRTFWIGLLTILLIGIPILVWWFVWSLIRIVKGMTAISVHKPIANPRSWLFG